MMMMAASHDHDHRSSGDHDWLLLKRVERSQCGASDFNDLGWAGKVVHSRVYLEGRRGTWLGRMGPQASIFVS
jgi:hypothetical protein